MRITEAVDEILRKEQGLDQGEEPLSTYLRFGIFWSSAMSDRGINFVNFFDFEKAFDSVHRTSLWKILRQYGIPQKIVYIITLFYNNFTCCVQNSSSSLTVNSGVRQGCVMSSFLFILIIDWIMKNGT